MFRMFFANAGRACFERALAHAQRFRMFRV